MSVSSERFSLVWTATFLRTVRKFLRRHLDIRGIFEDLLRQLEKNPHSPRLRLHALKGRCAEMHAVSLTYEYRIALILKFAEREVILLDVGTHDEVYRG